MKNTKWLSLALAFSLCCGSALGEEETLSGFSASRPGTSARRVTAYVQDSADGEIQGAYSAEIIWGDMEFAWGGGKTWDPASHTLIESPSGENAGWYLLNSSRLSGPGPNAVGNPDHSHVLVFNHSYYGIQVEASMEDSNLDDNVIPKLHIDPRWGAGLDTDTYEFENTSTGIDSYKVKLDGGTIGLPYNNGTDPAYDDMNCVIFKLQLNTRDNAKPEGIDSEKGIANVSVSIEPLDD